MKAVKKAVIPAAGLGTRVLPATKAMPKGMLPIVDKPAIQYLVEEAVRILKKNVPGKFEHVQVKAELTVRASTAPVAS